MHGNRALICILDCSLKQVALQWHNTHTRTSLHTHDNDAGCTSTCSSHRIEQQHYRERENEEREEQNKTRAACSADALIYSVATTSLAPQHTHTYMSARLYHILRWSVQSLHSAHATYVLRVIFPIRIYLLFVFVHGFEREHKQMNGILECKHGVERERKQINGNFAGISILASNTVCSRNEYT